MVAMVSEDHPGAAEGEGDELPAVGHGEHDAQQPREHQAHEEGEAQQERHAPAAVLGLLDAEEEAEGDREEQHEADRRMAREEGEFSCTPIHAPSTVGSMEIASSQ